MRRRLLRLAATMILVPVAAEVATLAADELEKRKGPSALSKGLRRGGSVIGRYRR